MVLLIIDGSNKDQPQQDCGTEINQRTINDNINYNLKIVVNLVASLLTFLSETV